MRALMVAALLACTLPAWGQQSRGDWFKSLKQPKTGYSCCDVSDCKQTKAVWQGNGWWAEFPDGQVRPIPPEKILDKPKTIDGKAYLCSSPTNRVYCFVPPWTGF